LAIKKFTGKKNCSVGLNLTVWNEKNVPLKLLHWHKKVPLEQKLKFIQLDTILPLKFKKNVSLEQIIPLEPMEKNVPSQLPGGKKKELAKLGLNHQWAEQKTKTEWAARV